MEIKNSNTSDIRQYIEKTIIGIDYMRMKLKEWILGVLKKQKKVLNIIMEILKDTFKQRNDTVVV